MHCVTARFTKKKTVAVVGGGDGAVKEALLLSNIASKVYIIYRKDKLMPEPINLERLEKTKNIEQINKANIVEFIGKGKLEKIKLDRKYKGSYEMDIDGVFVDIGRVPITEMARELKIRTNEKGEIITDKLMRTNIEGFFAAGDVTDTSFKQAITAASEGSTAAYSAYQYIIKSPLCTYDDEPIEGLSK